MTAALCAPARCREVDPEMWFEPWRAAKAKAVCHRCEVEDACLTVAMAFPDDEQWGVFGGLDAAGRRALRASDPEAWPVQVAKLDDFYDRAARYGEDDVERDASGQLRVPWGEQHEMSRPPVDWAADALEANVAALMDRYQTGPGEPATLDGSLRYPTDTQLGYALTDESGIVLHVNEVAA